MATKNVTLSIDEDLLKQGREYARRHGTSLNELIRKLLRKTVCSQKKENWIDELFELMDQMPPPPLDFKWSREEAYGERLEWPRRS